MFTKEVLKNGVKIVTEKLPNVRSLSVGIWVGTGSRNEVPHNNGVSHFIEHMLFKGTSNHSAKEIAETMDDIGGQINAFTGKEATCFYTKTLDDHYKIAIDLLADMFFNSTFSEQNISLEKGVVLEEIGMYEDSLEELVHDILTSSVWKDNSLGYPILGTPKTLGKLSREDIIDYYKKRYIPKNTVISVAGSFNQDEIVEYIKKYFENWNTDSTAVSDIKPAEFRQGITLKSKKSEQTHILLAMDSIEYGNDELYSLLVVNNIFGGNMSSRLFQRIREEKGAAYSVYSSPTSYLKTGLFSIYAGLNPSHTEEVIKIILEELDILKNKGLSKEEISKSKEHLKGSYILGLEGTGSRMSAIGKSELLQGIIHSPDEMLKKIDDINEESVKNVIGKVFGKNEKCLAVVGKINKDIDFEGILKAN